MMDPNERPHRIQRDPGSDSRSETGRWMLRWKVAIRFEDGAYKKSMTFTDSTFGEGGRAGENPVETCSKAVWDYWKTVFEWSRKPRMEGYGPITLPDNSESMHGRLA